MERRTIKVDVLARVEGEGALRLVIEDGKLRDAELRIFEPPRFFEAFLRGRSCMEVPDITARICGICPVAYQMSAVHAMEDALGITITPEIRELRRLLYCGEWIESHVLHMYMLHAPDFLGYDGAVEMAKDHPDVVRDGLALKKVGNEILRLLGGREIHPINVRVGGFYRVPSKRELRELRDGLLRGRDASLGTVKLVAGFEFPDVERDYEFVSLGNAGEYPFNAGHVVSNKGLDITPQQYDAHFEEFHVKRSNALHSRHIGHGAYLTGPLARYSLNSALLSPLAQEAAAAGAGSGRPATTRSAASSSARWRWCTRSTRRCASSMRTNRRTGRSSIRRCAPASAMRAPRRRAACCITAIGWTPKAACWTRRSCRRRRRTSRASRRICWILPPRWLDLPDEQLGHLCEQAMRNHDPCISCATHFLKLDVVRG